MYNKYSMLVRKKCHQYKMCVYYSQGVAREPKVNFLCLIIGGTRNLITLIPMVFLFVDEGEHFIRLVIQNKSRA